MADACRPSPSSGHPDSDFAQTWPGTTAATTQPQHNLSDGSHLVEQLREGAAQLDLDTLLSGVATAALELTEASGAALALWSQGAVICRARGGEMAPPLGAKLDVDSGISGQCLRTGRSQRCDDTENHPMVDAEVCRQLGIRSLAAEPLRGPSGVVGILEVFSDRAYAFSDAHVNLLKQLAQIAVDGRERATTALSAPRSDLPATLNITEAPVPRPALKRPVHIPRPWGIREQGRLRRMAVSALILLAGLGGFVWLLTEMRQREAARTGHPGVVSAANQTASPVAARFDPSAADADMRALSAGGSAKPSPRIERSASEVVLRAAKTATLNGNSAPATTVSTSPAKAATPSTASPAPAEEPTPPAVSQLLSGPQPGDLPATVVSSSVQMPTQAMRISQGLTGGTIAQRTPPIYPLRARLQHIEGAVVLEAMVGEDGNVRQLKVMSGDPILAAAAKEAVARWHYVPFQLDGKPIAMRAQVTVQFKLPQ